MYTTRILSLLTLAATALAKTDLAGCTSSETVSFGGAYMLWYVPGTGELCAPLDCGGGQAPPKTTVPGCAAYVGTASYQPSYLPGYGPNGGSTLFLTASAAASTAVEAASTSVGGLATYTVTAATSAITGTTEASSFATITSAASLSISKTMSIGGNNLTATATVPSTTSQFTGAASAVAVKEVFGLAVGMVAGLAMF